MILLYEKSQRPEGAGSSSCLNLKEDPTMIYRIHCIIDSRLFVSVLSFVADLFDGPLVEFLHPLDGVVERQGHIIPG